MVITCISKQGILQSKTLFKEIGSWNPNRKTQFLARIPSFAFKLYIHWTNLKLTKKDLQNKGNIYSEGIFCILTITSGANVSFWAWYFYKTCAIIILLSLLSDAFPNNYSLFYYLLESTMIWIIVMAYQKDILIIVVFLYCD